MAKIEAEFISKEIIKPSSSSIHQYKPFNLPFMNQLCPTTYSPVMFFYTPNKDHNFSITHAIARLKTSLSQTLTFYYPFSGRVVDNICINDFSEGVPFLVSKVTGTKKLSDFLKNPEIECLNKLLPCQAYAKETHLGIPQLQVQVSVFSCEGIVIGLAVSHKLSDAPTGGLFIKAWATICRTGSLSNDLYPNCNEGSVFFPTKNPFPEQHLSLMESLWFTENEYVTKRFVFDSKAISSIRMRATGEKNGKRIKPTRVEALSCFIWKCSMAASRAAFGSPKVSILVEAVNLRTRTNPPMSNNAIGDIFWWANAIADPSVQDEELIELATLLDEAISVYDDSEYMKTTQGEEGFESLAEYCNQLEGLFELEKPDIFAFTSWCHLGVNKVNFGWGEPTWIGLLGKAGPAFRNLTVFVETLHGRGIEAWITLDQERMAFLERDPHFLAFASPNPKISCM